MLPRENVTKSPKKSPKIVVFLSIKIFNSSWTDKKEKSGIAK